MNNVVATFSIGISLSGDNSDGAQSELGTAIDKVGITAGVTLSHGVGANQANVFYHDRLNVPTGVDGLTIAINDTSLKDAFGVGLEVDKLKVLYIKNRTGGNVTIGAATANQFAIFGTPATDTLKIKPDGEFLYVAPDVDGLAIDGAKDELKIVHDQSGTKDVDVVIIGVRTP